MRSRFLFFLVSFLFLSCMGHAQSYTDLQPQWKVWKENRYQPYHASSPVAYFQLLPTNDADTLWIRCAQACDLYINQKFKTKIVQSEKIAIQKLFAENPNQPFLQVAIFNPHGRAERIQTGVLHPIRQQGYPTRYFSAFENLYRVSFFILFVMSLLYFRADNFIFFRYLFSMRSTTEQASPTFFIIPFLLVSLLWSLLLCWLSAMHLLPGYEAIGDASVLTWIRIWAINLGWIVLWMSIRMAFIFAFHKPWNQTAVALQHYEASLRFWWSVGLILGLLAWVQNAHHLFSESILRPMFWYVGIALFVHYFVLLFTLRNKLWGNYLFLFLYFCGTEAIPLLVLTKLYLNA